jgi:2-dehydropantoate 2-reductase
MRVLVVGAGAIGGYFGARLLQAGIDVTFLVRPRRAEQLKDGLKLSSPMGDLHLPSPPMVSAAQLKPGFDLILLSCKAYDLDDAMDSFAPAVDSRSAILPMLNGMRHLVRLRERFGDDALLGGCCNISSTVDAAGTIVHFHNLHQIIFGELSGASSERIKTISSLFARCNFQSLASASVLQNMWDKWIFIASFASATALMRASVGDIIKANGSAFLQEILRESMAIGAANGYPIDTASKARSQALLADRQSTLMASMLRDIERGGRIEADQIVGDLLECAHGKVADTSRLQLAYLHLKAYEQRRTREDAKVVSSG